MTYDPNADRAAAGPDARVVADAINGGWIGRGFKLGLGFFLAGLVIWLIPILLLASCVGGLAAMAGGAAISSLEEMKDAAEALDRGEGEIVTVAPATPGDTADAQAAAAAAEADTAAPE